MARESGPDVRVVFARVEDPNTAWRRRVAKTVVAALEASFSVERRHVNENALYRFGPICEIVPSPPLIGRVITRLYGKGSTPSRPSSPTSQASPIWGSSRRSRTICRHAYGCGGNSYPAVFRPRPQLTTFRGVVIDGATPFDGRAPPEAGGSDLASGSWLALFHSRLLEPPQLCPLGRRPRFPHWQALRAPRFQLRRAYGAGIAR